MQSQCIKNDWIGVLHKHHIAFLVVMLCFYQHGMKKEDSEALFKYVIPNIGQYQIGLHLFSLLLKTYFSELESAGLKGMLKSIISRQIMISAWITWSSVLNCFNFIAELVNERISILETNFGCEADLIESCFNVFSCCCNCVTPADTFMSVWHTSQCAKFTDFFDGLTQE